MQTAIDVHDIATHTDRAAALARFMPRVRWTAAALAAYLPPDSIVDDEDLVQAGIVGALEGIEECRRAPLPLPVDLIVFLHVAFEIRAELLSA